MRKLNKAVALVMALAMLLGMTTFAAAEEGATYSEAPSSAAKVESGVLPPVAERLPVTSDIMVETMDDIGQYTADFTLAQGTSSWTTGKLTEEPLFRFKTDGTVEPNVAKGYDVNEDSTVYTIYLREGMKWSDGVPFTSEDCRFFYEEVLLSGFSGRSVWNAVQAVNPETGETENAKLDIIDDYTFTMTFASSKPDFLPELAINGKWFFAPKHWLTQYMASYIGEEAALEKANGMGYSDLSSFNGIIAYYYWLVPDRPTLRAWKLEGDFNASTFSMKRNDYFWKVDADGKQLPYIDSLVFLRYEDDTQPLMWSLDGTIDLYPANWTNIVEFKQAEAKGNVKVNMWNNTSWSGQAIQLNQAVQDDDLRALFQNINFRHALSVAVDRQVICDLVDDGFSVPSQSAPQEGQQGYDPEWVSKWTEYDPELAKSLLAECGLELGSDGMWYFAGGEKQVVLNMIYQQENIATFAELLVNYFEAIGLKCTQRMYDRSYVETMQGNNEHEVVVNPNEKFATVNIGLRPDYLVPTRAYPPWASEFGAWYDQTDSSEGMEPSDAVKELLAVYDQYKTNSDPDERKALALQMLDLHKENVWEIGYASPIPTLFITNAKLHNFPEVSIFCDEFRDTGIAHPECWWIEE